MYRSRLTLARMDAAAIEADRESPLMTHRWGVAMAAADKTPGNADELLPVYLRLSQAERERQERLSQSVNS